MERKNIKIMHWYIRAGRFIYGTLFVLALTITFAFITKRWSNIYIIIFLDITWILVGVILESNLIRCRGLGTTYVDVDKREDKFDLIEYHINNENYYVSESENDYVVKLYGEQYFKSYNKCEVTIEENPNIDRPIIEIITTEKISRPANNEYSIFALTGDKIKTENSKIIVRNIEKDIKSI